MLNKTWYTTYNDQRINNRQITITIDGDTLEYTASELMMIEKFSERPAYRSGVAWTEFFEQSVKAEGKPTIDITISTEFAIEISDEIYKIVDKCHDLCLVGIVAEENVKILSDVADKLYKHIYHCTKN